MQVCNHIHAVVFLAETGIVHRIARNEGLGVCQIGIQIRIIPFAASTRHGFRIGKAADTTLIAHHHIVKVGTLFGRAALFECVTAGASANLFLTLGNVSISQQHTIIRGWFPDGARIHIAAVRGDFYKVTWLFWFFGLEQSPTNGVEAKQYKSCCQYCSCDFVAEQVAH